MRANPRTRSATLAFLALLWLAPAAPARADEEPRRADPLEVPTGGLPEPEAAAALSVSDRVLGAAEILRERGYDEELIQTILSHADHTGVPRTTAMRRALFAVDELCGLVTAATLVRPSKKIDDLETSSVKKKLKDKAFARNVSREDIAKGAELIGVPLDEHIGNVIAAMKGVAGELGL